MRALTRIALCATGGVLACVSETALGWERIEAVGGMAVGSATRLAGGRLRIPVRCDLAGLDSITSKPTQMNSGLGVARLKVELDSNVVFITVIAGIGAPAQCPAIEVDYVGSSLRAAYRSPDRSSRELGPVVIAP